MADFSLTAVFRDFKNFSYGFWPDMYSFSWGLKPGWIESDLDDDGKPVLKTLTLDERAYPGVDNFAKWYRDVDGVNQKKSIDLTFTLADGYYAYESATFFPIDGELWGNEGHAHNYSFTAEISGVFWYQAGQSIKLQSDDDCLIFIDGKLAVDRFGIVLGEPPLQTFNLDTIGATLGLVAGQAYEIKIFFAERHPNSSIFKLYTSFKVENDMIAISQWITGSGTVTPAAGAYAPGSQTVTAIPSAGYRLSTLTVGGAAHVSGAAYNFTTHATITAAFEQTASSTAITRLKIIHRALRIIGVLTEGQLPSAAQVATAKEALSCYIHALQDKGIKLWTEEWVALPLSTASSTVLGTDGNYYQCIKAHTATAANCPVTGASWSTYWMKTATATTNVWASGTSYTAINQFADTTADVVDQAFIRDVYGVDYEVQIIQTVTANEIPSKLDTGIPSKLWHVKDITNPYIYMWPIPDLLTYVLHYRRVRYLTDFTSDYASGDWPQSWQDAVVFGLAARLSFEYGVPIQEREELKMTAEQYEHIARGYNHERPTHQRFTSCY